VTGSCGAARPGPPAGYAAVLEQDAAIVALPSVMGAVRSAIADAGTLYGWACVQPGATAFAGRGAAYAVAAPGGAWVVRHYRRGGTVAPLLGDRYLRVGAARPLRELHASVAARARGVATPEVVAAVVYAAGIFYRADLATRQVPESADLAETVLGRRRGDAGARCASWHSAGLLLHTAFHAGVEHADLNLRNILIQPGADGPAAYLLDLDRARVRCGPVADGARAAMLERLHRSRRKLEARFGTATTAAELGAFDGGLRGVG
jgi:3-deoxy-D-manno-octulosonic acid kinase